ncbi:MAG: hypothetical protein Q9167_004308 [Letrouitia subvulpina]
MSSERNEADQGPDIPASSGGSQDEENEEAEENVLKEELSDQPAELSDEAITLPNQKVTATLSSPLSVVERPSSADGSLSIPDDTPSLQSPSKIVSARISPSPSISTRAVSPAFLNAHSRNSSVTSRLIPKADDSENPQPPWEIVKWTKLRQITGHAFSEVARRKFGRPTSIAISTSITLGTSKGLILVFDYNQNLKSIIGLGTKAVESGAVTSISISADHSTVAGGHKSGTIFTWEFAKPAKPFLEISPIDRRKNHEVDGHVHDVEILHVGFLGSRHTALVSADGKGMAFSHLATRGMGSIGRTVKTTRILGRYPETTPNPAKQRKPSAVLAFSPLPLGNVTHLTDTSGLVAMLTPYLLVIVSTTPIAQTQYKTPRPKEVAAHSALTAALAWFPSVKLKKPNSETSETNSRVKLVYCWSNILTVLEVVEVEPSSSSGQEGPPNLQFRPRSRWKAQEAIVAVQWISRSVLAVLTITQQLAILEDSSLRVTNSSDLIQKHIYHVDLFSQHMKVIVEQLDEEDTSMHGVVADAFYMSFRAYKGRLFLLGFNDLYFGTLSNWADRLLALIDADNFIGAIELATAYYTGQADKSSVGLPEDDDLRHEMVREKLLEMMSASLRYTFGKKGDVQEQQTENDQLEDLATACISACVSVDNMDFLFDETYSNFQNGHAQGIFIETLESFILEEDIKVLPPTVIKDLVFHYTNKNWDKRLEELIYHLDPRTMDLDQITTLCKRNNLYDALIYVWNQALDDYITLLNDLLGIFERQESNGSYADPSLRAKQLATASKIFPYLSYILTGRIYPTGKDVDEEKGTIAKAEVYAFFFSSSGNTLPNSNRSNSRQPKADTDIPFPNLRRILDFDASSFLSMLNEAFEDSFLNGSHDHFIKTTLASLTEAQKCGLSVNRQWIVNILLEVMTPPKYEAEDTVYLHMFIARNLPKYPQFILLPGYMLYRVLTGLCQYPSEDIAEDCQLSAEYLLSIYQPPDLQSLVPMISKARFYRVLRSIYRSERQYARLLETCFQEGYANGNLVFECIAECLRPSTGLTERQSDDVRAVITNNAFQLVERDVDQAASTINMYAADLHEVMLQSLNDDSEETRKYQYLKMILETPEGDEDKNKIPQQSPNLHFIETYVRLLCEYDPSHVTEYVEHLKQGDLRLEEVLPALEESGVVDAAVILIAREGRIRDAINRLSQHLQTLEGVLVGLLDGVMESPDLANTAEAAHDLVNSIQKFARIGVWLCQGQTRSAEHKSRPRKSTQHQANGDLTEDETLWLDLIYIVVTVNKNVSERLQAEDFDTDETRGLRSDKLNGTLDITKLITDLRTIVQEAFTALLAATSTPRATNPRRTDVSFLKILRAFLTRASLSSPSLSNLRSVLSAIFSAYSYEESLLTLSNRLLDKDLFLHVREADSLRRRGWRPRGQVCEGCGRRVWGPGTGVYVWDAWQKGNEKDEAEKCERQRDLKTDPNEDKSVRNGKGKIIEEQARSPATNNQHLRGTEMTGQTTQIPDNIPPDTDKDGAGPLVIFSCRHIFHRSCLEKMKGEGAAQKDPVTDSEAEFVCLLCAT